VSKEHAAAHHAWGQIAADTVVAASKEQRRPERSFIFVSSSEFEKENSFWKREHSRH